MNERHDSDGKKLIALNVFFFLPIMSKYGSRVSPEKCQYGFQSQPPNLTHVEFSACDKRVFTCTRGSTASSNRSASLAQSLSPLSLIIRTPWIDIIQADTLAATCVRLLRACAAILDLHGNAKLSDLASVR